MGETAPGSGFRTQHIAATDVQRLVAALDLQDAAAGVRRLRSWTHDTLAPRSGQRVLDVGSGTGSQTVRLADAVGPEGEACGVEPNPGLRAVAEERAAAAGSRARFTDGDALALPAADGSVDLVWCERVLQHLTEADRAVAEMARVVRPGGRVALLDTDWATTILHPGEPEVMAAYTAAAVAAAANPYAGRRLAGQLEAAGLVVEDRGAQALLQDHRAVPWPLVRMLGASAVRRGLLTEDQRDRAHAGLEEAAGRGGLHMSVTMFAVVARRPS
ncbi:methyltransferase domain-containing protein [Streptomyces tropicalis]|uniref:Methyltransferase domain-containing protein n=1 Tax=Streptomyces tropicalis TaxID=3034234 RepID=A0ABT6ABR3_9ACTN|nr:methyltransferase domain-containing protein [Streptomyces tropicalis]MDF3301250.1 methyltransferase domain-containing protein [Streptomyces tropicalis]